MDYDKRSIELHRTHRGKISTAIDVPIETKDDLSLAYTPGVGAVSAAIAKDPSLARELTIKGRSVAVLTDGSSVLGLGDIGPEAALPVMEGKAALFKRFANLDAYPICLDAEGVDAIVAAAKAVAPGFGAINLEDIAAPECFEVERRLVEELDIPVMHDDQHGTATVILAGLLGALKVTGKRLEEVSVVIAGAGAAGIASAKLLLEAGITQMAMTDSRGIIAVGREGMNPYKDELAAHINPDGVTGTLADALKGADVFIGVSRPGIVSVDDVRAMAPDPIIFAMSNPVPEIMPDDARAAGAAVVATGRSDFPNQANNVLAFPGIFLGAMEAGAATITPAMRVAAAHALASLVPEPTAERILPSPLDEGVARAVADAVKSAA